MKNVFFTVLFAFLSTIGFSQDFVMVGNGNWTTINDSTYQSNTSITFQADLTGKGYLATAIDSGMYVFTGTEGIYLIDSVWNKTFSTAEIRVIEREGTNTSPSGQIMVSNKRDNGTLNSAPFGSTGSTAQLGNAVENYNSRILGSIGSVADGAASYGLPDPTGGKDGDTYLETDRGVIWINESGTWFPQHRVNPFLNNSAISITSASYSPDVNESSFFTRTMTAAAHTLMATPTITLSTGSTIGFQYNNMTGADQTLTFSAASYLDENFNALPVDTIIDGYEKFYLFKVARTGTAKVLVRVGDYGNSGGGGSVTSVGLTMPSGFSVAGSPVTTSGTLAVTSTLNGAITGNGSGFAATAPTTGGTTLQLFQFDDNSDTYSWLNRATIEPLGIRDQTLTANRFIDLATFDLAIREGGGSTLMSFDESTTNVGIGTATPSTSYALTIQDDNFPLRIQRSNGTDAMHIKNVIGHGAFYSTGGRFLFSNLDSGSPSNSMDLLFSSNPIMRIKALTAGSALIDIDGQVNTNPGIRLYENSVNKWYLFNNGSNDEFRINNANGNMLILEQDGDMAIGTKTDSPAAKFEVQNENSVGSAPTGTPALKIFQVTSTAGNNLYDIDSTGTVHMKAYDAGAKDQASNFDKILVFENDDESVRTTDISNITNSFMGTTATVTTANSPYTLTANDGYIIADATAGNITINLNTSGKQEVYVVRVDNTGNTVTVSGNGKNILGAATDTSLNAQWASHKYYNKYTVWTK